MHLYVASARAVTILRVGAPKRRVVAKVPMAKGWTAQRLLLAGHRLVVFSERFNRTRVTVLDVRQPKRPRRLRQLELDERPLQERGLGGDVLLVLEIALRRPFALLTRLHKRHSPPSGTVNMPCCSGGSFTAQKARVKAWAKRALASVPMRALLPQGSAPLRDPRPHLARVHLGSDGGDGESLGREGVRSHEGAGDPEHDAPGDGDEVAGSRRVATACRYCAHAWRAAAGSRRPGSPDPWPARPRRAGSGSSAPPAPAAALTHRTDRRILALRTQTRGDLQARRRTE